MATQPELYKIMYESGCYQLTLACESGVQRVMDEIILKNLFALMLLFLFHHIINPDELKGKGKKHEQNKAWIIRQTKKEITILKAFEGWFQSTNSQQELNACKQTKKTSN